MNAPWLTAALDRPTHQPENETTTPASPGYRNNIRAVAIAAARVRFHQDKNFCQKKQGVQKPSPKKLYQVSKNLTSKHL